jgi:hypothetical protein
MINLPRRANSQAEQGSMGSVAGNVVKLDLDSRVRSDLHCPVPLSKALSSHGEHLPSDLAPPFVSQVLHGVDFLDDRQGQDAPLGLFANHFAQFTLSGP